MKRFLILSISLILIIVVGLYLYYVEGYYFDNETKISTPFYIKKDTIYQHKDKTDIPLKIRGVELDSAYGPKRRTDFTIDEQTWLRWFNMIQQMGANTIRVSTILDDQFYKAFYQYNNNREEPLYLLQGMQVVTDEVKTNKNKENLLFYKTLMEDGKDLVDIIHGRKVLLENEHKGSGVYRYDVSPWVVGFLIGDEWDQDLIAYIDKTLDSSSIFNGEYVTTSSKATNFEAMMAGIIEQMIGYESRKYHIQRPISVNSSSIMDPFQYKEQYATQLGKFNTFTIDHIKPTAKMKAGIFASYAYEELEYPILQMIESRERTPYANVVNYLDLLNQAHLSPVVISSFGHPSVSYLNNESKQESELINRLKMFDEANLNGAIIRSWQDVWDRRTQETSYAVDLQQIHEWHDPITATQHFGLIGFKPYRSEELMRIDGDNNDWQDVEPAFHNQTKKIVMTRDHTYLYLWLEDTNITANETFYLALDSHPQLGSKSPDLLDTTFDRKIDFVIQVIPKQGATFFVQDRYQSARQNFLERVTGTNPFVSYPKVDSNTFEKLKFLKHNKEILAEEESMSRHYNYSFEKMSNLTSLYENDEQKTDIAIENGRIEMRIPYQLLNIYDPLKFTIHDDYYQNYGVDPLKIEQFYLSILSKSDKRAKSVKVPVQTLKRLKKVKEYVKPSYHAVKMYWRGDD
ncbi:hypothetical protein [Paraliobacillus sp. JSM ZJ581]|uniref:hypothetical protein n=1 Tax=Paraliobacillus sp. JSM ZJ581 TaxID=3342118 RepID=UPI0035A910ED